MKLALRTQIPFAVWADEDEMTVLTAFELLAEADEEIEQRRG